MLSRDAKFGELLIHPTKKGKMRQLVGRYCVLASKYDDPFASQSFNEEGLHKVEESLHKVLTDTVHYLLEEDPNQAVEIVKMSQDYFPKSDSYTKDASRLERFGRIFYQHLLDGVLEKNPENFIEVFKQIPKYHFRGEQDLPNIEIKDENLSEIPTNTIIENLSEIASIDYPTHRKLLKASIKKDPENIYGILQNLKQAGDKFVLTKETIDNLLKDNPLNAKKIFDDLKQDAPHCLKHCLFDILETDPSLARDVFCYIQQQPNSFFEGSPSRVGNRFNVYADCVIADETLVPEAFHELETAPYSQNKEGRDRAWLAFYCVQSNPSFKIKLDNLLKKDQNLEGDIAWHITNSEFYGRGNAVDDFRSRKTSRQKQLKIIEDLQTAKSPNKSKINIYDMVDNKNIRR